MWQRGPLEGQAAVLSFCRNQMTLSAFVIWPLHHWERPINADAKNALSHIKKLTFSCDD